MKPNPLPSLATLQRLFAYDPSTGTLTWRTGRNRNQIAGCKTYRKDGSPRAIRVKLGDGNQESAQVHRIIWKLMTGRDPANTIDHADVNPFNNSWSNLREATQIEQNANKRQFNRTGFKGVMPTPAGRFAAYIGTYPSRLYLGTYDTPEEAHMIYMVEASKRYGPFARE